MLLLSFPRFGTQDEALETLTLCQTGKYGPVPMILIDRPGGTYWQEWDHYLRRHLVANGLISPEILVYIPSQIVSIPRSI